MTALPPNAPSSRRGYFQFNNLPKEVDAGQALRVWVFMKLAAAVDSETPIRFQFVGLAKSSWLVTPDSPYATPENRAAGAAVRVEKEEEFHVQTVDVAEAKLFEKGEHAYMASIKLDSGLFPTYSYKSPTVMGEEFHIRYIVRAFLKAKENPVPTLEKELVIRSPSVDGSYLDPFVATEVSPSGISLNLRAARAQWLDRDQLTLFASLAAPKDRDVQSVFLEIMQRFTIPDPMTGAQTLIEVERIFATFTMAGCQRGQAYDAILKLALPPIPPSVTLNPVNVNYTFRAVVVQAGNPPPPVEFVCAQPILVLPPVRLDVEPDFDEHDPAPEYAIKKPGPGSQPLPVYPLKAQVLQNPVQRFLLSTPAPPSPIPAPLSPAPGQQISPIPGHASPIPPPSMPMPPPGQAPPGVAPFSPPISPPSHQQGARPNVPFPQHQQAPSPQPPYGAPPQAQQGQPRPQHGGPQAPVGDPGRSPSPHRRPLPQPDVGAYPPPPATHNFANAKPAAAAPPSEKAPQTEEARRIAELEAEIRRLQKQNESYFGAPNGSQSSTSANGPQRTGSSDSVNAEPTSFKDLRRKTVKASRAAAAQSASTPSAPAVNSPAAGTAQSPGVARLATLVSQAIASIPDRPIQLPPVSSAHAADLAVKSHAYGSAKPSASSVSNEEIDAKYSKALEDYRNQLFDYLTEHGVPMVGKQRDGIRNTELLMFNRAAGDSNYGKSLATKLEDDMKRVESDIQTAYEISTKKSLLDGMREGKKHIGIAIDRYDVSTPDELAEALDALQLSLKEKVGPQVPEKIWNEAMVKFDAEVSKPLKDGLASRPRVPTLNSPPSPHPPSGYPNQHPPSITHSSSVTSFSQPGTPQSANRSPRPLPQAPNVPVDYAAPQSYGGYSYPQSAGAQQQQYNYGVAHPPADPAAGYSAVTSPPLTPGTTKQYYNSPPNSANTYSSGSGGYQPANPGYAPSSYAPNNAPYGSSPQPGGYVPQPYQQQQQQPGGYQPQGYAPSGGYQPYPQSAGGYSSSPQHQAQAPLYNYQPAGYQGHGPLPQPPAAPAPGGGSGYVSHIPVPVAQHSGVPTGSGNRSSFFARSTQPPVPGKDPRLCERGDCHNPKASGSSYCISCQRLVRQGGMH
ncbi:hypothetical protein HDU96_003074 [Phlyctochytrium bullatum]|nr:hypothetical protein HDU96_003074 [Phlyctochytrium bullatum]